MTIFKLNFDVLNDFNNLIPIDRNELINKLDNCQVLIR